MSGFYDGLDGHDLFDWMGEHGLTFTSPVLWDGYALPGDEVACFKALRLLRRHGFGPGLVPYDVVNDLRACYGLEETSKRWDAAWTIARELIDLAREAGEVPERTLAARAEVERLDGEIWPLAEAWWTGATPKPDPRHLLALIAERNALAAGAASMRCEIFHIDAFTPGTDRMDPDNKSILLEVERALEVPSAIDVGRRAREAFIAALIRQFKAGEPLTTLSTQATK